MQNKLLKRTSITVFLLCCAIAAPLVLHAQNNAGKVLVIQREYTKPGKDGSLHEKTEGAYVAMAKAGKAPFHYIAMNSLSGVNRTLFFSSFPSFAAWEAERKATSPALLQAMDKANIPDGDLLTSADQSVWTISPEYSLNTDAPRPGSRIMEIEQFVVKPGHDAEWDELAKMVVAGYKKGVPSAHWTTYQMAYGNSTSGSIYLVLTAQKSMSEIDEEFASDKSFGEAIGKDGLKKLAGLEASCIESRQSNLFLLNPAMSLPPDGMVAGEPDFWAPKPKPVVKKPAQ